MLASGRTNHMMANRKLFVDYHAQGGAVEVASNDELPVRGGGTI